MVWTEEEEERREEEIGERRHRIDNNGSYVIYGRQHLTINLTLFDNFNGLTLFKRFYSLST